MRGIVFGLLIVTVFYSVIALVLFGAHLIVGAICMGLAGGAGALAVYMTMVGADG